MDGDQTFAALVEGINYFGLSAKSSNTSPILTISSEHIQTVHLRMLLFKALLGCATLANVAYAQKVFAHFMVCPGHQFATRHNHSPKLNHATIRQRQRPSNRLKIHFRTVNKIGLMISILRCPSVSTDLVTVLLHPYKSAAADCFEISQKIQPSTWPTSK